MIPDNIFLYVASATTLIKVVVDMIRISAPNRPSWISPVLAVCLGPLVVSMIMVSNGELFSQVMIAHAFIAGILAGGTAIGVTEGQKRAN